MKPKEAFEKLQEILLITFNLDCFDEELGVINQALTDYEKLKKRAEKVEDLLGLYRLAITWVFANSVEWKELERKIKAIEEELK